MEIKAEDTALVVTDPQNDVLSEKGVAWGLVGASVRENKTVEHLEQLFKAAKTTAMTYSFRRTTTIPPTKGGCPALPSRR